MKALNAPFWGQTKAWWVILIVGILMVICGFAYWFFPEAGFAIGSQIFGWLLILFGIVQLCAGAGPNRAKGWGWWIAGGVIDMFIGFLLVRSIALSEIVFPYFLAFAFIFFGIVYLIGSVNSSSSYWWVNLICGVLSMVIGFFFIEAGYLQDMMMTSLLVSIAFIFWGFCVAMISYDMKPTPTR